MRSPIPQMMIGALVWLAVGCQSQALTESVPSASPIAATAIETLQKATNQNAVVTVKGNVGAIVPLLEGTVYELQDGTGKVWIRTKQAPPKTGEAAIVRGTVRFKSILIDGQEQGSLYIEQE